jgi:DeoR/GlpR family transcriptional regulator of sugar metabolism
MNKIERLKKIMDILYQQETISTQKLESILRISSATIRRDLQVLVEKGLIVRYKGGASLPMTAIGHEPPLHERVTCNLQNKRQIALAAASLVKKGEVIALDIGSTTMEVAKLLRNRNDITIFTYGLAIANIFVNTNVKVYLVGGLLQQKEMCLSGHIARDIIRQFHYDKFFLGAAGISEGSGVTDFGMDEVETKKTFLDHSKEVIAVLDSSKFGKVSFATICKCEEVNKIITDENIDPDMQRNLQKKGVSFVIAKRNENTVM